MFRLQNVYKVCTIIIGIEITNRTVLGSISALQRRMNWVDVVPKGQ